MLIILKPDVITLSEGVTRKSLIFLGEGSGAGAEAAFFFVA